MNDTDLYNLGRCSNKNQKLIKTMQKDLEDKIHFHMGQAYMFRGMLDAFLKASKITFEEVESGTLVHIKLGNFEEDWTGPGAEWVKMHYGNKTSWADKLPEALKENTYIQWNGTGLNHPKGFKKE